MNNIHTALVAVIFASTIGIASAEIPEEVKVGGIFDFPWADGAEAAALAEIAVGEFNEYLNATGAEWTLSMSTEDAQEKPAIALEKIQAFKSVGVDMLLGVAYSSHIKLAANYVGTNNMLVISHASQAEELEIDDSIFRLVPSDSKQAPAISKMLNDAGIEVLITVVRGDAWGDGLVAGVERDFNGMVISGFRYNPEASEFSVEVSLLDEDVGELIDEHGADKVGVFYVGTDEFLPIIQSMGPYEQVSEVRWFSSNTQSRQQYFIDDPIASQFAEDTQFTTTGFIKTTDNHIKDAIDAKYKELYNDATISPYGYSAYDSVWLLGTSILQTQSVDTDILTKAIPLVASRMMGASGSLALDEYGDLNKGNYEIWQVSDGAWTQLGAE